jgi:hypothetical protein
MKKYYKIMITNLASQGLQNHKNANLIKKTFYFLPFQAVSGMELSLATHLV